MERSSKKATKRYLTVITTLNTIIFKMMVLHSLTDTKYSLKMVKGYTIILPRMAQLSLTGI